MEIDYGIRIGIFYADKKWAEQKFKEICKYITESGTCKKYYNMTIEFGNGSYIKFVPAYKKCCGQRFNRIYYQEGIDREILMRIVYPTLLNPNPLPLE